jgi:DNA mismatch endonuclease (patch repair protein)
VDSATAKKIKSKNTKIELALRKELWKMGYRYRIHDKTTFGTPDIVFRKQKIAIFCDSEFWHGKKYIEGQKFKKNALYWETKIKNNIKRDKKVNKTLKKEEWTVLRFWGEDIIKEREIVINKIKRSFNENRAQLNKP